MQPDRDLYRNNIAAVLVEIGRVDDAVAQVAAVYGEPIAHYNVGILLKEQGKRRAAADQFALALEADPSLTQVREWLDRLNENQKPREQMASAEIVDPEPNSVAVATAEREMPQATDDPQGRRQLKRLRKQHRAFAATCRHDRASRTGRGRELAVDRDEHALGDDDGPVDVGCGIGPWNSPVPRSGAETGDGRA